MLVVDEEKLNTIGVRVVVMVRGVAIGKPICLWVWTGSGIRGRGEWYRHKMRID